MNIETLYLEPRVYAYTLPDVPKLNGWIKVGYTERQTTAARIAQQLKTPHLNYRIELDEPAATNDGRHFRDSAVHDMLEQKGFRRARFDDVDAEEKGKKGKKSEWFRCSVEDVKAVVSALQEKREPKDAHLATFGMRPEQARAVKMTADNFRANRKVKDVIENLETELFTKVTVLTHRDFNLLVDVGVFNSAQMNSCIWQFRAYEEESLDYLHSREAIDDDAPLVGGWDSSISKSDAYESLGQVAAKNRGALL